MSRLDALAQTAERWSDPDADPRHDAVHETLHAENSFTEEATAFAINQLMALLSPDALDAWTEGTGDVDLGEERATVVIEHGTDTAVDGLREAAVAILVGARVRSLISPASPAIVPAFYDTFREVASDLDVPDVNVTCVTSVEDLDARVTPESKVICVSTASGDGSLKEWSDAHGFRWIPGTTGYSVGIIDGSEPDEVRHNLAEDALLHEGAPSRSLRIVWAPRELTPDPLLEAMADFRGVFPAHDKTPGSLEMRRAFLEAADQSHAYAAGMQFLVSRGDPEPQDGAHLRWSEYDDLQDVADWVTEHADAVHALIVRPSLAERLPDALQPEALDERGILRMEPGHVHRPPLVTSSVRVLLDALVSTE